jgi:hypothetical protein
LLLDDYFFWEKIKNSTCYYNNIEYFYFFSWTNEKLKRQILIDNFKKNEK